MQAPPELTIDLELRDGTPIRVRPIQSDDKERLLDSLEELSSESRYLRFMSPRNNLTPRELRYLTEVDWRTHQAWLAVDPSRPGEPAVGGARCVRLEEDNVAEFAIAVVDSFHGKGLGSILLGILVESALEGGIDTLRAYVLPQNKSMLGILRQLGAHPGPRVEAGVVALDLPLWHDIAEIPDSPVGKFLKHVATAETTVVHPPHRL